MAMKSYLLPGSNQYFHERGLCISHDHLRVSSTDTANSVIGRWGRDGVIAPPQAVQDVFTTTDFDNIDHNSSSKTVKSALSEAFISIHQHFSSDTQADNVDILNTT